MLDNSIRTNKQKEHFSQTFVKLYACICEIIEEIKEMHASYDKRGKLKDVLHA